MIVLTVAVCLIAIVLVIQWLKISNLEDEVSVISKTTVRKDYPDDYEKGSRFNPMSSDDWEGVSVDNLHCRVLSLLPDAQLGDDNDGQIIIYTNLKSTGHHGVLSNI